MTHSLRLPWQIILIAVLAAALLVTYSTIAQGPSDITYPVAELNNCKDETECRAFCDEPANIRPCVAFAEEHGFMTADEAAKARKFADLGAQGPGGCTSKESCEAYCEDVSNIEACLAFGEENGFLEGAELEEARKVAKAVREGAQFPGGCRGKNQCEEYCNDISHIEECFAFGERSGLIPPEELADARKAADAIGKGHRPPGNCRGKAQCETYCQDPNNVEECIAFAEAAGFIPPEELEQVKKILPLMKAGKMPGGCRGKEQCEAYCQDESHLNECAEFAIQAGFMKPEEVEMFRKTGGKGPGGCKGKEQCETFCNDPANSETCFNFAAEHDLIPAEELQKAREGMQQLRENLSQAPPEVATCLQSQLGQEVFEKIQAGILTPGPQIGDLVRKCFEEAFGSGPPGEHGGPPGGGPGGGFGGPGGCRGAEECTQYCSDPSHQEECSAFQGGGPGRGGEGGPPGEFPGQPPEGFPGHPGEFPGRPGEFPARPPEEFPGGQFPEGFRPGEGSEHPPFEGIGPVPGTPGIFQPSTEPILPPGTPPDGSFEQQYQQQFQQEYQNQYEQQYQQQQEQYQAPSGSPPPPSTEPIPAPPPEPPPPPPPEPPPPSGRLPARSFLASFFEVMRGR